MHYTVSGVTSVNVTYFSADINECVVNPAICGIGTCMNKEGTYTCMCPEGHMLMLDKNCMGKLNTIAYNDILLKVSQRVRTTETQY